MVQEKSLYINLATLPDIDEQILQEDNDKKEKVPEDHLEEKSKIDKIQIVNDKTELSDIANLEEEEEVFKNADKKEKVREDHLEEKSKSDKIQIVNDKTELSDIANLEEEEEAFKNAGGDEQNKDIETSIILLIDWV